MRLHCRLTLPQFLLRERLSELARQPRPWLETPVGLCAHESGADVEWVAARLPTPARTVLRLGLASSAPPRPQPPGAEVGAWLWLGREERLGEAWAWARGRGGAWQPVGSLYLPGPGLPHTPGTSRSPGLPGDAPLPPSSAEGERWSRTRAALGEETHRRVRELTVGILGCGRTGSLVARNLARLGVRRLVLADPDVVEPHNLGEGEFTVSSLGEFKVDGLAGQLALECPETSVSAVAGPASQRSALDALKACEVLVSAPDQPAARLAAGALAAAYARPLLDVGTRIWRDGPVTMGGDVRLIAPERCLLCFGGVADEPLGRQLLESPDAERSFLEGRDWRQERPGSLRSLNEVCASVAQRMLEELVVGRLGESTWCRLEFQRDGRLAIAYPEGRAERRQPCFCEMLGWGDAALPRVLELLARRAAT